jgi:RND family efflux transporter MFP subunit
VTITRRVPALILVCVLLSLAGCKDEAKQAPPVRPVLSVVIAPDTAQLLGFTGTVEPRYSAGLGFRVLGRMISRDVDVGDEVKTGTQLAAIDPVALQLAVRSAIADVATARARLKNASGSEERQRTLLGEGDTPQAQYESAQLGQDTAVAAARSAEANLAKAEDQLQYAQLRSDTDGVVTAVSGQVGQVVQPGQVVVTVARPDIREANIDVPDDIAGVLKPGTTFDIALQLDPSIHMQGQVREIAPESEATTRTRRVRISMTDPEEAFRLGTTITATPIKPSATWIDLPRSAVLERDGKHLVWIVDPKIGTVDTREVAGALHSDASFRVTGGLAEGDRVVTVGVHSLTPGEHVKLPKQAAL